MKEDKKNFKTQGSTYNESSYRINRKGTSGLNIREELDSLESNSILPQGPNKFIFIGIGIFVLLIIILSIILVLSKGFSNSGNLAEPALYQEPAEVVNAQGGYSPDQIEDLRLAGYTADEIEKYELSGDDPSLLITLQDEKIQQNLREKYKFLIDNISNEDLKKFIANTIYVNPQSSIPALEKSEYGEYVEPQGYAYSENADYWKVPLHGYQAFLKCKLKSGEIVFMQIPISRYATLRDSGNIVITYTKTEVNGQVFIQDIYEERVETEGLN